MTDRTISQPPGHAARFPATLPIDDVRVVIDEVLAGRPTSFEAVDAALFALGCAHHILREEGGPFLAAAPETIAGKFGPLLATDPPSTPEELKAAAQEAEKGLNEFEAAQTAEGTAQAQAAAFPWATVLSLLLPLLERLFRR